MRLINKKQARLIARALIASTVDFVLKEGFLYRSFSALSRASENNVREAIYYEIVKLERHGDLDLYFWFERLGYKTGEKTATLIPLGQKILAAKKHETEAGK